MDIQFDSTFWLLWLTWEGVPISLWKFDLNFFSCIFRNQNARSYSSSFWIILGELLYYFPFRLYQLHSPSEQVFPFLHVLVHICYFSSSCEHPLTSQCVSLSVSFIPLEICIFPLDPQWLLACALEWACAHACVCVPVCVCVILRIEPQTSSMLGKCSTTELHPSSPLSMVPNASFTSKDIVTWLWVFYASHSVLWICFYRSTSYHPVFVNYEVSDVLNTW